jgi:hypothetical protein
MVLKKPKTLLASQESVEECKRRLDKVEARGLEFLFLDRSDEATRLLGNFVFDHAPVPPSAQDNSFSNWLLVSALCVTVMAGGLLFRSLETSLADLGKRVAAQEARAFAPTAPAVAMDTAIPNIAHIPDIFLDLDQRCWLQITDGGGKVLMADFVPAGRREAAPGAKLPITVRDGCPGHVAFTVDGRAVDPPREPGHAENKVEVVVLP